MGTRESAGELHGNSMKLAIVGSRDFVDYDLLRQKALELFEIGKIDKIISGGARGADTLAERFADEFNIPKEIHPADWKTYGRAAGYIRNQRIVRCCDELIAFWMNNSSGTKHSIELAKQAGKKVHIVCV